MNDHTADGSGAYREVVRRFCPYVGENVVMLMSSSGDEKVFECVNRDACDYSGGKTCKKEK
ncbi:MAG: hypothetical protein PUE85_04030 [Firmicutes bacterium]|nr:hypothetical protein [Bacillota bacterium]